MNTALVHDWLISPIGGAENTLKEIYGLFPGPIHTLVWNPKTMDQFKTVHPSWIQKLPKALTHFRSYLPLFPFAIEQFDLSTYDLIISSSHCVAKGVKTHPNQIHICYCHTPMRYAWDLSEEYLSHLSKFKGWIARKILRSLQQWDKKSTSRVTHFIANSHFVAARIKTHYNRSATVIYPPVDTIYFDLHTQKQNYYLTSSRLVAYKKIDLIVEAFAQMPNLKLVVIGDGPELQSLRKKGTTNIEFLGAVPNEILRLHLQQAKAFVFAAIEDFGILPIEAMACGTPVIALNQGGTAETVIHHKTGILFEEQSTTEIKMAVKKMEKMTFDPVAISKHAAQFSKERFRSEFKQFVESNSRACRL